MGLLKADRLTFAAIAIAGLFGTGFAHAEPSMREYFYGKPPFQAYVQRWSDAAARTNDRGALLMVHGGAHTGVGFTTTPKGEPGWAIDFARAGWTVYVVDWPGMGRSGVVPGNADQGITDVADTLTALVESIQPAVVMGHSIGGALAIKIAERVPNAVRAVVALAPASVELPNKAVPAASPGKPIVAGRDDAMRRFANSDQFPKDAESLDNYLSSLVAMSPNIRNAAVGLTDELKLDRGKLDLWRKIPVLFLVAEQDRTVPRALSDETAKLMGVTPVALGTDWGLPGHGHMFPLETGHHEISQRIDRWLSDTTKK